MKPSSSLLLSDFALILRDSDPTRVSGSIRKKSTPFLERNRPRFADSPLISSSSVISGKGSENSDLLVLILTPILRTQLVIYSEL